MKMSYLFGILIILSVVSFGCTHISTTLPAGKKDFMIEKKAMEENEMAEIGFEMKNGKMIMVDAKAKTENSMDQDATLNDGTKVMTSGKVVKNDGTTFMLKEGESMWMDGSMLRAGEMMEENSMMESEYKGQILAGTTSKYLDFTKADYDKALKENKKILLYFYASWCPLCKKEQPEIMAAFNELTDQDLVGFRVHYNDGEDNNDAKALTQQFQVPYQHTKVIIKDGKQVLKAPDSWGKQRYLTELAKI